jgi:hypothetical protein
MDYPFQLPEARAVAASCCPSRTSPGCSHHNAGG